MASSPISKRKPVQAQNSLRVLIVNFQSLKKKGMLLGALVSFTEPDIIVGTETRLNDQIASSKFISNQLDYNIYQRDRPTDTYGGVLLGAKRELILSNLHKSEAVEFIRGTIKLNSQKPVIIAIYYRSQKRVDDQYLNKTKEEISSFLDENKNLVTVLAGD